MSWECTEEERNFSFNFPQLQILHPRALCFYWNGDQKTPSVYDALKHGGELDCGIVNLYIWRCLSAARINSFIEDFACFTKTDDCNAPRNHVYHLDMEDRGWGKFSPSRGREREGMEAGLQRTKSQKNGHRGGGRSCGVFRGCRRKELFGITLMTI